MENGFGQQLQGVEIWIKYFFPKPTVNWMCWMQDRIYSLYAVLQGHDSPEGERAETKKQQKQCLGQDPPLGGVAGAGCWRRFFFFNYFMFVVFFVFVFFVFWMFVYFLFVFSIFLRLLFFSFSWDFVKVPDIFCLDLMTYFSI